MAIQQISVFVENKQGKLVETIKKMADNGINIRAMSIADTKDFGILRMITSDNAKTKEVLSDNTVVNTTDVIAVKMADTPGALYKVMDILSSAGVNIEYLYAFTASDALGAYVVFRVDDVPHAQKLMDDNGMQSLNDEDIVNL
ncbi:MAG: amino acid-binding protein [Ruminococcus sp.]|nr:amino acid-binding protein [Ruminococcus sp.]MBQ1687357.1 amino acid-binding protein [Ruminococcus sp.]MEE0952503.1 amino acid-binding protein [Ruminococcus sp.]